MRLSAASTLPTKLDLAFVIDTTGSMSGLIQGAKDKVWSIAKHIVSGKPTPDVSIGLVAYRDLGDAVWAQVSSGRLHLPKELGTVLKALEVVTKKIQEQNQSINDLLSEGVEVASRLKGKLATAPKKTGHFVYVA